MLTTLSASLHPQTQSNFNALAGTGFFACFIRIHFPSQVMAVMNLRPWIAQLIDNQPFLSFLPTTRFFLSPTHSPPIWTCVVPVMHFFSLYGVYQYPKVSDTSIFSSADIISILFVREVHSLLALLKHIKFIENNVSFCSKIISLVIAFEEEKSSFYSIVTDQKEKQRAP